MINRSNIIYYGIMGLIAGLSFALCNPRPKHNPVQTFKQVSQPNAFDTARQLKWIYLDSLLPSLEAACLKVQQEMPTCAVSLETKSVLRLSVAAGCESAFNRAFLGVHGLQQYCAMAPYPIKAVASGYGFECPIADKRGRRAVYLPVDILQTVVQRSGASVRNTPNSVRVPVAQRVAARPRAAAPPRVAPPRAAAPPVKPKKKK